MPSVVGSFQQGAFTSPVNGTPNDANDVLANDNALRARFNSHDADPLIHVQSSVLASRPAAGVAGRVWVVTDGRARATLDTGSAWADLQGAANATADTLLVGASPPAGAEVVRVDGGVRVGGALAATGGVSATSIVVGTDPTGSELLRVGGAVRSSGLRLDASSAAVLELRSGGVSSGSLAGTASGVELANGAGTPVLTIARTGLAAVLGSDPGGSELLRVGGSLRLGSLANGADALFVASAYGLTGRARFFGVDGNQKVQLGATTDTSAALIASSGVDLDFIGGSGTGGRLRSDGNWVIGPVDPGGAELFRVGGAARIGTTLAVGSTLTVSSGAIVGTTLAVGASAVVAADPGGTQSLRVGGPARVAGTLLVQAPIADGAPLLDVRSTGSTPTQLLVRSPDGTDALALNCANPGAGPLAGPHLNTVGGVLRVASTLDLTNGSALRVAGTQVVGARQGGWIAGTGTPGRGIFAADTLNFDAFGFRVVCQRLLALELDLRAHGLIGA